MDAQELDRPGSFLKWVEALTSAADLGPERQDALSGVVTVRAGKGGKDRLTVRSPQDLLDAQ